MVKAILFDLWGTLFHEDMDLRPIQEFAHKLGRSTDDYFYLKAFEESFMTKPQSSVEKTVTDFLNKLHILPEDDLVMQLCRILRKSGPDMKPFEDTIDELGKLEENYKLCLITNCSSRGYKLLLEKYDFEKHFDVLLPSYKTRILKPDPRIFKLALKKLKVKKEDSIMVGDSLKDDVEAAEKFGIKGILIDRFEKYPDVKDKITSLKELKKLL